MALCFSLCLLNPSRHGLGLKRFLLLVPSRLIVSASRCISAAIQSRPYTPDVLPDLISIETGLSQSDLLLKLQKFGLSQLLAVDLASIRPGRKRLKKRWELWHGHNLWPRRLMTTNYVERTVVQDTSLAMAEPYDSRNMKIQSGDLCSLVCRSEDVLIYTSVRHFIGGTVEMPACAVVLNMVMMWLSMYVAVMIQQRWLLRWRCNHPQQLTWVWVPKSVFCPNLAWVSIAGHVVFWVWALLYPTLRRPDLLGFRIWDPGGLSQFQQIIACISGSSGVVLKENSSYYVKRSMECSMNRPNSMCHSGYYHKLLVLSVHDSGRVCNGHSSLRLGQVFLVWTMLQIVLWMCCDIIVFDSLN